MTIMERFLRYVAINTESCEGVETVPSSQRQFDLAHVLTDSSFCICFASPAFSGLSLTGNFIFSRRSSKISA